MHTGSLGESRDVTVERDVEEIGREVAIPVVVPGRREHETTRIGTPREITGLAWAGGEVLRKTRAVGGHDPQVVGAIEHEVRDSPGSPDVKGEGVTEPSV